MEFAVNVLKMPADGACCQTKAIGYFLVREPEREQFNDFLLAWPEIFYFCRCRDRLLEGGDDLARDFPRHGNPTQLGFADGRHKLFRCAALE